MRRRRTETKRRGPRMVLGKVKRRRLSRLLTMDSILFSLFILSYFSVFLFNFLFLEQLRLEVISHAVTSVTN